MLQAAGRFVKQPPPPARSSRCVDGTASAPAAAGRWPVRCRLSRRCWSATLLRCGTWIPFSELASALRRAVSDGGEEELHLRRPGTHVPMSALQDGASRRGVAEVPLELQSYGGRQPRGDDAGAAADLRARMASVTSSPLSQARSRRTTAPTRASSKRRRPSSSSQAMPGGARPGQPTGRWRGVDDGEPQRLASCGRPCSCPRGGTVDRRTMARHPGQITRAGTHIKRSSVNVNSSASRSAARRPLPGQDRRGARSVSGTFFSSPELAMTGSELRSSPPYGREHARSAHRTRVRERTLSPAPAAPWWSSCALLSLVASAGATGGAGPWYVAAPCAHSP